MKLQYNENAEYMERFLRDYIEAHQLEQSRIALDIALRMHRESEKNRGASLCDPPHDTRSAWHLTRHDG